MGRHSVSNYEDTTGLVTSKGCVINKYKYKQTESTSNEKEIIHLINNFYRFIFIRIGGSKDINDFEIFCNNLHLIKKNCILITCDGVRPMPSTFPKEMIDKILNNSYIKYWYIQNYDRSIEHEKMGFMPVGFDLHTSKWFVDGSVNKKIRFMIKTRLEGDKKKRKNKIFSDTYNSVCHPDRIEVKNIIKDNKLFDIQNNIVDFKEITKKYNQYNFVISPRGVGLDCHRTWELFLAGVIVILKTSSLDQMYLQNNLPVIILNEWSELNDLTEDKLNQYLQENQEKRSFQNIMSKLTFEFWLSRRYKF